MEGLEKLNSIRFDNTLRYWAVMSANDLGASLHPINYGNRRFWGNNRQVAERKNAADYVKCMFFGRVVSGKRKKRDDTRLFQKSLKERFCGPIAEGELFTYLGTKERRRRVNVKYNRSTCILNVKYNRSIPVLG